MSTIDYQRPDNNIISYQAYSLAKNNINNSDYPYFDECAQIITNNPDNFYAFLWATKIGTHIEEMFTTILESNDIYSLAQWFQEPKLVYLAQDFHIKERVIGLEKIEIFLEEMNHISSYDSNCRYANYSLEDFYSDLPIEYRIEVII